MTDTDALDSALLTAQGSDTSGHPQGAGAEVLEEFNLQDVEARLEADIQAIQAGPLAARLATVDARFTSMENLLQTIHDRPAVDPIALAAGLLATPDLARALGVAIAAQLNRIGGTITLSGSLSGGIVPPTV